MLFDDRSSTIKLVYEQISVGNRTSGPVVLPADVTTRSRVIVLCKLFCMSVGNCVRNGVELQLIINSVLFVSVQLQDVFGHTFDRTGSKHKI